MKKHILQKTTPAKIMMVVNNVSFNQFHSSVQSICVRIMQSRQAEVQCENKDSNFPFQA